jgi:hypothetical protein
MSQFLEYQNIVNYVDSFLSEQEINSMHPSASWKIVPIFFQARAVVLAFFI